MRVKKRGQAALEFLTTYGWAFLVILIMMSALAYFGVLNPSKFLPDRCNFGSEVRCNKNLLVIKNVETPQNALTMRVSNNFGTSIVVTNAKIITDVIAIISCEGSFTGSNGVIVIPGKDYLNADGTVTDDENPEDGIPDGDGIIDTFIWSADDTITFAASCVGGQSLVKKEKVKFNIEMSYYPSAAGTDYAKIVFGEVFAAVQ